MNDGRHMPDNLLISRTSTTASAGLPINTSTDYNSPCLDPGGRGVLSGKVGTGMCGPERVLFRSLRFSNGPFFI